MTDPKNRTGRVKQKAIKTFLFVVIALLGIIFICFIFIFQPADVSSMPIPTGFSIDTTTVVPSSYFKKAQEQGHIERVVYSSKDYTLASQPTIQKHTYVFLPYNYHENEPYDIIYLIHGWLGNAEELLITPPKQELKNLFDNMIQHGLCRPFIAVFPTWDKDNQSKGWEESAQEIAAFYHEYENELIPAVESRYSTYADTINREGIIASRNHRAIGGFSLGSVTTWFIFEHCLPLQRYYLPMSADSWAVEMRGGQDHPLETAQTLAKIVSAQNTIETDFHLWFAVGTKDFFFKPIHQFALALMEHPEAFTPTNYSYHVRLNGPHDFSTVWEFCYNALPYFFPNENYTQKSF